MKRKRDHPRDQPKDETNYFFPTIILHPELLIHIFDHIITAIDMLNIYRLLYQYHQNNKEILNIMEIYLKQRYKDPTNAIISTFDYYFRRKLRKLDSTHIDIETPCNVDGYIKEIIKFKENRYTKIFIKYGICVFCMEYPKSLNYDEEVENYSKKELETKYISICDDCNKIEGNIILCNKEEMKKHINHDYIFRFFAKNNGIRYYETMADIFFYSKDLENYETRKLMMVSNNDKNK